MKPSDDIERMAASCLCGQVRLVARRVTRQYDEALRPFGIQASQLNLLAAVAHAGPLRRSQLGEALELEPSTLTRNMAVLIKNGWIEDVQDGADGRAKLVRVTPSGHHLLERVAPAWAAAQARAAAEIGADGAALMRELAGGGHGDRSRLPAGR